MWQMLHEDVVEALVASGIVERIPWTSRFDERIETGLPDRSCDAAYMRAVFHHVSDRSRFAVNLSQALRPGGRLAVIDFAPGTLWFHGANHGVSPDSVQRAFESAGLRLVTRDDHWGGGMFLLVFEHPEVTSSN